MEKIKAMTPCHTADLINISFFLSFLSQTPDGVFNGREKDKIEAMHMEESPVFLVICLCYGTTNGNKWSVIHKTKESCFNNVTMMDHLLKMTHSSLSYPQITDFRNTLL